MVLFGIIIIWLSALRFVFFSLSLSVSFSRLLVNRDDQSIRDRYHTAVCFDTLNFAHLWWRWTAVACGKPEAASSSTATTTENILNEFQSVAEATNSAWRLDGRLMVTGEVPRTATRRSSTRRHLTFSLHRTSAPFPQITVVDVCRRFIIGVTLSYIGLGLVFKVTELTIRDAILTCARKPTWVSLIYRTETTTKKCKT